MLKIAEHFLAGFMWKSRDIEKVIADLRTEVGSQKACITQYSFQAIGFTGITWGVIFKIDGEGSPLYLCGCILVTMLLAVVRMANHKYATVNRNLGYELHLNRLKDYVRFGKEAWAIRMQEVGWEEAMCAWRIVQPTMFNYLYDTSSLLLPYKVRNIQEHTNADYKWYATQALIHERAGYHPGTYLRNVHLILHFCAAFSLVAMWIMFLKYLGPGYFGLKNCAIATLLVTFTLFFVSRFYREQSFRRILEQELLSIQSSAVVWRLVVTCHILAVEQASSVHKSYKYYTKYTSLLALNINANFYKIHDWLTGWDDVIEDPSALYAKLATLLEEAAPKAKQKSD